MPCTPLHKFRALDQSLLVNLDDEHDDSNSDDYNSDDYNSDDHNDSTTPARPPAQFEGKGEVKSTQVESIVEPKITVRPNGPPTLPQVQSSTQREQGDQNQCDSEMDLLLTESESESAKKSGRYSGIHLTFFGIQQDRSNRLYFFKT